ncbi:hypothetical protein Q5752_004008 [Cryptotrichosporon argae]
MDGYPDTYTAIGSVETDQVILSGLAHPPWTLTPIPLSRIRPWDGGHYGPARSLQSYCLQVISRNLDLLEPSTLASLPAPLVDRVAARARADRGYDMQPASSMRPDEATLWALLALADPCSALDFSLALPASASLPWLAPRRAYEHPLTLLPKLFSSMYPAFDFLTTLSLSCSDSAVNDTSIQALAGCTHLTALWTRSSRLTDAGIRLLAAALDLPGPAGAGRGMRRLRAWYLAGSRGVTDKSMRSFARYPGLVVLDVRDTSCSDAALAIFNSATAALFPSHPAAQPVTPGLRALFSLRDAPERVLAHLRASLAPSAARSLALHLTETTVPLPAGWLATPPVRREYAPNAPASSSAAYIGAGVGQLYGANVAAVHDEQHAFRAEVANSHLRHADAAHRAAHGDLYARAKAGGKRLSAQRERDRRLPHVLAKARKMAIAQRDADARSRAFVMGSLGVDEGDEGEDIRGSAVLMMVRVLEPGWDSATWARAEPGPRAETRYAPITVRSTDVIGFAALTALATPAAPDTQASPSPVPAFKPLASHASSSPTSTPPRRSNNPFRRAATVTGPTLDTFAFTSSGRKRTFGSDTATAPAPKRSQTKLFVTSK